MGNLLNLGCGCCSPCTSCSPCFSTISLDTCKVLTWSWAIKDLGCGRAEQTDHTLTPDQDHAGCSHIFRYCDAVVDDEGLIGTINRTYGGDSISPLAKCEVAFTVYWTAKRYLAYSIQVQFTSPSTISISVFFNEYLLLGYRYTYTLNKYTRATVGSSWVLSSSASGSKVKAPAAGFLRTIFCGTLLNYAIGASKGYTLTETYESCNICKTYTVPEFTLSADMTPSAFNIDDTIIGCTYGEGFDVVSYIPFTIPRTHCTMSSVNVTINCRTPSGGGGGV